LDFGKSEKLQGAKVNISWLIKNLK